MLTINKVCAGFRGPELQIPGATVLTFHRSTLKNSSTIFVLLKRFPFYGVKTPLYELRCYGPGDALLRTQRYLTELKARTAFERAVEEHYESV